MNKSNFVAQVRDEFFGRLEKQTNWGRNQMLVNSQMVKIKEEFNESVADVLWGYINSWFANPTKK